MLGGDHALVPVPQHPPPEFSEPVAILLENMQKIASPEYGMTTHDYDKQKDQSINDV